MYCISTKNFIELLRSDKLNLLTINNFGKCLLIIYNNFQNKIVLTL